MQASSGNFYSPELSTDFLELPQSLNEQWNYYRFFYNNEPFVGQALDLHTELPLSKVRLGRPKANDRRMADASLRFCERWIKRIGLLQRLLEIIHDYFLIGEVYIFCEDANPDMPQGVRQKVVRRVEADGTLTETWVDRDDANERAVQWMKKNYVGWTNIRTIPPEQVHLQTFPFTDEILVDLIPDSKSRHLLEMADQGDKYAARVVESMDPVVVEALRKGENVPLSTDPDGGSFVHYMANKKSQYEPRGHSILQRCLLPGTLMTVCRDGVVRQVPVEEVDTSTDLLLTHRGRFRRATAGSRPVQERVVVLHVEGVERPPALTVDHEVLLLREDGTESWVPAGEVREGDVVRESHVVPDVTPIAEIDLAEWWRGRTIQTPRRFRENEKEIGFRDREIRVVDLEDGPDGLTITFEHNNDDAGQIEAVEGMRRFLNWLKGLDEPTEASYEEISAVTGVPARRLRNYAHALRKEAGLRSETRSLGRGKGRRTTWWPPHPETQVPRETRYDTLSSSVSRIKVDEDFCYLLGTWLGDGNVWTADEQFLNTHSIAWTTGNGDLEQEIKAEEMRLAAACLGNQCEDGHLFGDNPDADAFRIEDPLLARWFMDEFGHSAQSKRIPRWVFDLDDARVLALLRGLLDTDGCLLVEEGGASMVRFEMDNRNLLDQVHLLCNRLGIKTRVKNYTRSARSWDRRWETGSGTQQKTYCYEAKEYSNLYATRHADVRLWAEGSVKGSKVKWVEKTHPNATRTRFVNGWLTRKIEGVALVPYEGPVYSFDVEEDESHVTNDIVTHNCLRTLVYADKLRQAQTSIASRHMTPIRLVYAEDMDEENTEALRDQIDLALQDPDYTIVTNFQVTWEEMNSNGRLLELASEYDLIARQLYAGLGVTETLLNGESSYSGDRINLEVINTRYMLLRENVQRLVEEYFLKPMCRRMGFVEEDEDGQLEVIYPRLSFTRLALRDNQDTFDALFNLYQKGSLDIETILDLLNIDPVVVRERLEADFGTFNDSQFNEVLRSAYGRVGDQLVEGSDIVQKIAEILGLEYKRPEEPGRF
jgi:intein/homing endonuclease